MHEDFFANETLDSLPAVGRYIAAVNPVPRWHTIPYGVRIHRALGRLLDGGRQGWVGKKENEGDEEKQHQRTLYFESHIPQKTMKT